MTPLLDMSRRIRRLKRRRALPAPSTPLTPLTEWASKHVPAYFPLSMSTFHKWLVPELERLRDAPGDMLNVVAPRGSAKSTWISFAHPLHEAVEEREPYILLLSDTAVQAAKYLESIKMELESNESLAAAYPGACGVGPVWRQDSIRLRNGVMIESLGTGAKIRGRKNRNRRPTLVVIDDPQNNDTIVSPLQRERDWEWLTREVMAVGEPGRTKYLCLGTALHRECIVMRLLETAGWRTRVFKSIVQWPARMDLWREWQDRLQDWNDPDHEAKAATYYETNQLALEDGVELLWPERESLLALMTQRASIGEAAFESEKQSNPVNPSACEWPPAYFERADFWFDAWPERLTVKTLFLDPSKGATDKPGDYAAEVRYGVDARGVEYVEADLRRLDSDALACSHVEHVRQFRPDGEGVEANTFQSLLAPLFQLQAAKEKVELHTHLVDNTTNKNVRIRRLTEPLARRKMRFKSRSPGTGLLVQQLRDFPNGEHDDGPDALEGARRLAIDLLNGRGKQPPSRLRA